MSEEYYTERPSLGETVKQTSHFSKRRIFHWAFLALLVGLIPPVLAQDSNFGAATLSAGFQPAQGVMQGRTGGSFSLSSIANRDRAGNLCVGFGDSTPDHILNLRSGFARLSLQIDSRGNDTTLIVQGPNGFLRCGDDTGGSKDASVEGTSLPAGSYRVWVGAFDAGKQFDYTLTVREGS
jgi:hypothetical protein